MNTNLDFSVEFVKHGTVHCNRGMRLLSEVLDQVSDWIQQSSWHLLNRTAVLYPKRFIKFVEITVSVENIKHPLTHLCMPGSQLGIV